MRQNRRFRAPFVITLASVASTLSACGGSTSTEANSGGTPATGGVGNMSGSGGVGNVSGSGGVGMVSGSGGGSTCPSTFPENGTHCSLPSGTHCAFPQGTCCPPWDAICQDGSWQALVSSCNPPFVPCPDLVPTSGTACGSSDPCAGTQYCSYGQCADGTPYTIAQCIAGAWSVEQANCGLKPCDQLSACECFDRSDCEAMSDNCICPCDYNCPGDPACVCACGGGTYLGCKTRGTTP